MKKLYNVADLHLARAQNGIPLQRNKLFISRCHSEKTLFCRDIPAIDAKVSIFDFSSNGHLLVSGDREGQILLWKVVQAFGSEEKPVKTAAMEYKHCYYPVRCLTMSQDSSRILSSSLNKIAIHDTHKAKLLCTVSAKGSSPSCVQSLAIQPGSGQGYVIATASYGGILRLFDIRRSGNWPVLEVSQRPGWLNSASFSPIEATRIAVAGEDGTELIDMRNPLQRLHFFPSLQGTMSSQFNSKGTRLLCIERHQPIAIYDLNSMEGGMTQQLRPVNKAAVGKFITSGCFAGIDDELVAAGTSGGGIYVWSTPGHPGHQRQTVEASLMSLRGHSSRVSHVRYSGTVCSLASSSYYDGTIKFWTPFSLPRSVPRGPTPPLETANGEERANGAEDEVLGPARIGLDMSSSDEFDDNMSSSSGEWMF